MTEQEFDNLECTDPSFYGWQVQDNTKPFHCVKVNYKDDEPTNRGGYTHYVFNDKIYNSK